MRKIKEILEALSPNLTDAQKGLLVSVHAAATPQQAYEVANGSANAITAKQQLATLGLIAQQGNQITLTQAGHQALQSNNLTDSADQMTEEGTQQMDNFQKSKQEYTNLESFSMLGSFVDELQSSRN